MHAMPYIYEGNQHIVSVQVELASTFLTEQGGLYYFILKALICSLNSSFSLSTCTFVTLSIFPVFNFAKYERSFNFSLIL